MKHKVVNHSLLILALTVSFGLFQAWREGKNPFAFSKNSLKKSNPVSKKLIEDQSKKDYSVKLYISK
jgi:hypothetical protein